MSSSPLLESFIQSNYATGQGVTLPPLWQVIYQEAIRGHHLLFRRTDVELFDREAAYYAQHEGLSVDFSEQMEEIAVSLVECSDLQEMIDVIDALGTETRRNLYFMYRRVLWMWRNYIKEQLN